MPHDQPPANLPQEIWNTTPALKPPPGLKSNFLDPEDRGPKFITAATAMITVMVLFYFNRVYTKLVLLRKVSRDDGVLLRAQKRRNDQILNQSRSRMYFRLCGSSKKMKDIEPAY